MYIDSLLQNKSYESNNCSEGATVQMQTRVLEIGSLIRKILIEI